MKIYDIREDTAKRLMLLDGELGSVQENVYLFVCREKEDAVLMWKYIGEAVARGIEVFQSATKDQIVKVNNEEEKETTLKMPIFTFLPTNTNDDVWIRDVIKDILREEERHNEEEERRYGDGTSHSLGS